ncbi:nuclear transport factor 2 family protein [Burkholderia pseudomallei]|nr:nuclear transport factor 2 family protein [Burkholderia pseudomallei]
MTDTDSSSVAGAVERLREAMLAGDGATLRTLVEDGLSYGHSSGSLQDRDDFVTSLSGTNSFKSLSLSKQTVKIVDDTAIVRHVFDSENNLPAGKTSTAHIGVLQVWKKRPDGWRLLARQAHVLPKD